MVDLYISETCPYCRKVMEFCKNNNIEYNKKDVSVMENYQELMQIGGKNQVPFLVDGSIKMYESDDIIEYLKNLNNNKL